MADLSNLYQWTGLQITPPAAVPVAQYGVPPRPPRPIDMPNTLGPMGQANMNIYFAPVVPGATDMFAAGRTTSGPTAASGYAPAVTFTDSEEEY